tara:strand:+ start:1173 stop:1817 length:645 start_codon:yes stop_codon:yes gene_type:complete
VKLLLENWREYLNEMISPGRGLAHHKNFKSLILKDINIPNMVGYHASSAAFDQFDNSRLGSNTDMGKAGEDRYNLDSYLGHMFVPDYQLLAPHIEKLVGEGNTPYMYSVTLSPGKVAVLDVLQFKKWFSAGVQHSKENLKEFGKWLKQNGYGGIHYSNPELKGKLMADTIQVFDAGNTNIRSVWNMHTDKRIRTKDLKGRSFADALGGQNETPT